MIWLRWWWHVVIVRSWFPRISGVFFVFFFFIIKWQSQFTLSISIGSDGCYVWAFIRLKSMYTFFTIRIYTECFIFFMPLLLFATLVIAIIAMPWKFRLSNRIPFTFVKYFLRIYGHINATTETRLLLVFIHTVIKIVCAPWAREWIGFVQNIRNSECLILHRRC